MAKTTKPETTKPSVGTPIKPIGSPAHRFINNFFMPIIALLYTMPDGEAKSGRTGSVVYQKNGVRRNFIAPPTFTTARAGASKGLFSYFQSLFVAQDSTVQLAWNNVGFTSVNRVNKVITISGRSGYARLNVNLSNSGQPVLTTPPITPLVAPPLLGGVLTGDDSAHTLSLAYTPNTDDGIVIVSATAPQRPSIFKPALGKFKMIGHFDGTIASPADLTAEYDAVFGTDAVAGVKNKIFVDVYTISANGNASPVVRYECSIVA